MIKMDIESTEKDELITYLLQFETIFLSQGKYHEMAELRDEFMIKNYSKRDKKVKIDDLLLIKAFYLEMGKHYEKALEVYETL